MKPVLIGVAGGSGSGKSTLCRMLAKNANGVVVVEVDAYYLDRRHVAQNERSGINYDEPAAFDVALLVDHLGRLGQGVDIFKPQYSFETHTRTGTEFLAAGPLVVVEGLLALWWEEVRTLCDFTVFLDVPADLRVLRRLRRDLAERGRTVDSVMGQYLESVRPMHERYVEPTRAYADLVVVNDGPTEDSLRPLNEALARLQVGLPLGVR